MKTKITSTALVVLAGLFTFAESAKAYIHMPDDLTWDANIGIFPVITQPAAAYYSAQRASESALSTYEAATSANNAATSAADSAWSAYEAARSAYDSATISREAATSAYNAALSAYNAAEAEYLYWLAYNDPDKTQTAYATMAAKAAIKISTQATYNIFEQYDATRAARDATETARDATETAYVAAYTAYYQSLDNVNAATYADPFSSFHIAVYSSQKIFNLATIPYNAALSAYNAAEADYLSSLDYNDPSRTEAAYATLAATWATKISAEAPYNESITTLRAAVSSANAVPEPSTYGLIGIGALGVAFAARRRKAKVA